MECGFDKYCTGAQGAWYRFFDTLQDQSGSEDHTQGLLATQVEAKKQNHHQGVTYTP